MIRKITLLFLLFIGIQTIAHAQTLDSVTIFLPIGMDTTCPGTQIRFTAVQSNDTFSSVYYKWYLNGVFQEVGLDTFSTTSPAAEAPVGDTIYCKLFYTNSTGLDSATSNMIIVYRDTSIQPKVAAALTVGSNPDCSGHPLTFTAYPINGGSAPTYQWMINGLPVPGEDSATMTQIFSTGDTISCQMVSNSTCSAPFSDIAVSNVIPILHDTLTAAISILASFNPICAGAMDTFRATTINAGSGYTLSWYVDTTLIPSAIGSVYTTNTLHNGSIVYCVLNTPDPCVINDSTVSNDITMTVISLAPSAADILLLRGANPGCLDSTVTLTAHYLNFGIAPDFMWYIDDSLISTDSTLSTVFLNNDSVTLKVKETDDGCYTNDSIITAPFVMIRDSTPETPWLSLIGDMLVVNNGGGYTWYYTSTNTYTGTIIPGAINETYHPGTLGYYYVVKDSANCPSLPSNIIYISLLGVPDINLSSLKIYPNPTTGILNMDWAGTKVNMKVDVYNIIGQGLLHDEINGQSHYETNLSYLPEGNYFVVLHDEYGSKATYKIYLSK